MPKDSTMKPTAVNNFHINQRRCSISLSSLGAKLSFPTWTRRKKSRFKISPVININFHIHTSKSLSHKYEILPGGHHFVGSSRNELNFLDLVYPFPLVQIIFILITPRNYRQKKLFIAHAV